MKTFRILYIAFFFGMISLPGIAWLTGIKEERKSTENRALKEKPEFNLSYLDPFPPQFDSFYNDHFPYRNNLVFAYTFLKAKCIGVSPISKVIIGKNGWLYSPEEDYAYYTGKRIPSEQFIASVVNEVNYRYEKCRRAGIDYRVVVIPSKFSFYPEYLPPHIKKYEGTGPLEQFMLAFEKYCRADYLFLSDSLQKEKQHQLFRKGDTHWNDLGTYYGYRAISNWLRKDYPHIETFPFTELVRTDEAIDHGNIINQLALNEVWTDTFTTLDFRSSPLIRELPKKGYQPPDHFPYGWEYERRWINEKDSTLPLLMVIRDSYTNELMMKLLTRNFGRSVFIWDGWKHALNYPIISQENPKLVIDIMNERFLENIRHYEAMWEK